MAKIKIHSIGKSKEAWLKEALAEYEKRLPYSVEWHLYKDDRALEKVDGPYVALDPQGDLMTSEKFAIWFEAKQPRVFVIGGADGLTPLMRSKASQLISLSPLTFTHQMTRLILLEQTYRATQILKNTGYHKN